MVKRVASVSTKIRVFLGQLGVNVMLELTNLFTFLVSNTVGSAVAEKKQLFISPNLNERDSKALVNLNWHHCINFSNAEDQSKSFKIVKA